MSWHQFDPGKGFFDLPIIWVVGGAGLIIFLGAVGGFALSVHDLALCWDIDCLNYFFLEVMKVPIGILAFWAALLALLATHHRSRQSAEQNIFTNYYAHLKEFREFWDDVCEKNKFGGKTVEPGWIYREFFPRAKRGDLEISREYVSKLENHVSELAKNLYLLERCEPSTPNNVLDRYDEQLSASIKNLVSYGGKWGITTEESLQRGRSYRSRFYELIISGKVEELEHLDVIIGAASHVVQFDPYFDSSGLASVVKMWDMAFRKATGRN